MQRRRRVGGSRRHRDPRPQAKLRRGAWQQAPRGLGGPPDRRQLLPGQPQLFDERLGPGIARQVEHERARRVGRVGGGLAGQPQPQPVFRLQRPPGSAMCSAPRRRASTAAVRPCRATAVAQRRRVVAGHLQVQRTSAVARWSGHKMAGRSAAVVGRRRRSPARRRGQEAVERRRRALRPCIWPATARPTISASPAWATAWRTARAVARHQSPGSDSARPADGTSTGYSARPRPRTRPPVPRRSPSAGIPSPSRVASAPGVPSLPRRQLLVPGSRHRGRRRGP